MHDTLRIRAAQPSDAPTLTAIARASKAYWGYDAAFLAACAQELAISPEDLLRHPAYVLTEAAEHILGFYLLLPRDRAVIDLDYLYLAQAAIGRGYGRLLFEHAQHTARDLHFQTMQIQADPHAAPFYRRMGAQEIGSSASGSIPGRQLPLFQMAL